jgi:site-specific recombinase XerD
VPADFVPHDLRHRRATTWIADEKNVHHVQEAMGHSVIQTTLRYTHLAKHHLRSLVDEPDPQVEVVTG